MLQDRGHWLLLGIRCSDWLSRSGDNQVICYKTGVIDLLLVSKTSSDFVCLSLSLTWEREWVCIIDSSVGSLSLSYFLNFDMRERLVHPSQQWANWSDWESVTLHCWFLANGRSLKVRECHFTLLILSKWEFSQCERGLFCIVDSWQMEDFSKWERVILHCWFPANGSFLKNMCRP